MKGHPLSEIVSLAFLILVCSSCVKSGADCITSTGEIVFQERQIPEFDSIEVNNYANLLIAQDSIRKVIVEAGTNILAGIETTVENRKLIIRNTNSCNWIRSYDKPVNVYVYTPYLRSIYYNSSGNISSLTPMVTDSLKLEVWGGCGTIDLDLHLFLGYFYLQQGTADIHLSGTCGIASMYTGDFGLLDTRNLQCGYVFISSKSSNDCYIHVYRELDATIRSIGNIYYTGNPEKIKTAIFGSGNVIPF